MKTKRNEIDKEKNGEKDGSVCFRGKSWRLDLYLRKLSPTVPMPALFFPYQHLPPRIYASSCVGQ